MAKKIRGNGNGADIINLPEKAKDYSNKEKLEREEDDLDISDLLMRVQFSSFRKLVNNSIDIHRRCFKEESKKLSQQKIPIDISACTNDLRVVDMVQKMEKNQKLKESVLKWFEKFSLVTFN